MTSAQVPSRIAMKRPFAESGLLTSIADVDGSTLNYPTGFPSVYSVPSSSGGKYLGRGDINAIGNIATNDLFYHKCGGLNTFDAEFAAKIGGYPKNAILDMVSGRYIYSVMSLVDNNMVDFTGTIPSSAQASAGVTAGSVDNENWAYCNREESTETGVVIFEKSVSSSLPGVPVASAQALPLGCFLATKSGPIIVSSDANLKMEASISGNTMYGRSWVFEGLVGFGVVVYDLGTSMSGYSDITYPTATSLGDWKLIYSTPLAQGIQVYSGIMCEVTDVVSGSQMVTAQYGHYYAFAYFAASLAGIHEDIPAMTGDTPNYITGTATLDVSTVSARIG